MKIDTNKISFWYWWSAGAAFTWVLGYILTGMQMSDARVAFWIVTIFIMCIGLFAALVARLEKKL